MIKLIVTILFKSSAAIKIIFLSLFTEIRFLFKGLAEINERELTYNTALDIVFMNKCHNCGCTPKNDEWSDRAKNLCIDCKNDEE